MKGGKTMPINFFSNELTKVYDRFNRTFGKLIVFNTNTRQRIVFSIISLGVLEKKIMVEKNKDQLRSEIKRFVRIKNILNHYFDEIDKRMEKTEHVTDRYNKTVPLKAEK